MSNNFDLTTDADILTLAEAGELFCVEEGEARRLSCEQAAAIEQDDRYGTDWIVVRAETAAEAIAVAKRFDAEGWRSTLRDAEGVVAVCEARSDS